MIPSQRPKDGSKINRNLVASDELSDAAAAAAAMLVWSETGWGAGSQGSGADCPDITGAAQSCDPRVQLD